MSRDFNALYKVVHVLKDQGDFVCGTHDLSRHFIARVASRDYQDMFFVLSTTKPCLGDTTQIASAAKVDLFYRTHVPGYLGYKEVEAGDCYLVSGFNDLAGLSGTTRKGYVPDRFINTDDIMREVRRSCGALSP